MRKRKLLTSVSEEKTEGLCMRNFFVLCTLYVWIPCPFMLMLSPLLLQLLRPMSLWPCGQHPSNMPPRCKRHETWPTCQACMHWWWVKLLWQASGNCLRMLVRGCSSFGCGVLWMCVTVSLYGLAHQPPLYYDNYLTFTVRKRPRSIWGPIMLAHPLSVRPCFSFQTFWTHVWYTD